MLKSLFNTEENKADADVLWEVSGCGVGRTKIKVDPRDDIQQWSLDTALRGQWSLDVGWLTENTERKIYVNVYSH